MLMSLFPRYLILCALAGGHALFAQESPTPGAPYPNTDGGKAGAQAGGAPGNSRMFWQFRQAAGQRQHREGGKVSRGNGRPDESGRSAGAD
jgi:hypothetical protein